MISTSLGWYNLTPGDGSGEFATLTQSARNHDILWVTSAGNQREAHWGGAFNDQNSDKWHDYSSTQNINWFGPGEAGYAYEIAAGSPIRAYLRWDDWTVVDQDYDLYLVKWDPIQGWLLIANSTNRSKWIAWAKAYRIYWHNCTCNHILRFHVLPS